MIYLEEPWTVSQDCGIGRATVLDWARRIWDVVVVSAGESSSSLFSALKFAHKYLRKRYILATNYQLLVIQKVCEEENLVCPII